MKSFLRNLHNDESGQDLIEYALVAALIAVASIAVMGNLAKSINNIFVKIGGELDGAVS